MYSWQIESGFWGDLVLNFEGTILTFHHAKLHATWYKILIPQLVYIIHVNAQMISIFLYCLTGSTFQIIIGKK